MCSAVYAAPNDDITVKQSAKPVHVLVVQSEFDALRFREMPCGAMPLRLGAAGCGRVRHGAFHCHYTCTLSYPCHAMRRGVALWWGAVGCGEYTKQYIPHPSSQLLQASPSLALELGGRSPVRRSSAGALAIITPGIPFLGVPTSPSI